MAMNLMIKKLAALPIGTHIELIHQADSSSREKLCGIITDSDFTENVEITDADGNVTYQNFATVCNFRVIGAGAAQAPRPANTPAPNPVRAPSPAPVPVKALLRDAEPAQAISAGDNALKTYFDTLPKTDRQKLSAAFDSFRYGIKINDRSKLATAAGQARNILLSEDRKGYFWSEEAAMLCGLMLHRTKQFDPEVYLVGGRFHEAAMTAALAGQSALSGAYALVALLEEDAAHVEDLVILAAKAMAASDDASGLRLLHRHGGPKRKPELQKLIQEGFTQKQIQGWQQLSTEQALDRLEQIFSGRAIAQEVTCWLSDEERAMDAPAARVVPASAPVAAAVKASGLITRLSWADQTGVITTDDGASCTFRYADIASPALAKTIGECMRADLGGHLYPVTFTLERGKASSVRPDEAIVERVRAIFSNKNHPDRYTLAYRLATQAVKTTNDRRALPDLIRISSAIYASTGDLGPAREALALYEQEPGKFFSSHGNEMELVQCYSYFDNYAAMSAHTDTALSEPLLTAKQRLIYIYRLLKLYQGAWERSHDHSVLKRIVERTHQWEQIWRTHLPTDPVQRNSFENFIAPMRLQALCALGKLEEAESLFSALGADCPNRQSLELEMKALRQRQPKKAAPAPELPVQPAAEPETQSPAQEPEAEPVEESAEEVPPYADEEGWEALGMTKDGAIAAALGMKGAEPIAPMLSYLHAASRLNPEIAPLCRTVALAANDPMTAQDFDIATLMDVLAASDPDYPVLTDWCLSAAYLRASFRGGRDFDYSAQGLRESLMLPRQNAALQNALATLEQFRTETGAPMDLYAGYRAQSDGKQLEQLDALVRKAEALYTRFVLTVPREGASLLRLIETKKLLFAKDGELAALLRAVMERDSAALDARRDDFCRRYLTGSADCVSVRAVDALVNEAWDQAGRNLQSRKMTATIQGTLRNNLRASVSEVLTLVCQWYSLSGQGQGIQSRTEAGMERFCQLQPRLKAQLSALCAECDSLVHTGELQTRAGALLLADTVRELMARLDGSWRFGQEKYRYASLLTSRHVTLDEQFLPELDATLSALPGFHILQRIQAHADSESLSLQQHLDRIYGRDRIWHNYATARRILEYLEFLGQSDTVTIPEQPELFERQTRLQADMRLRSFRETYALAMNCGQIMRTDGFCCALEDIARHFHARCCETGCYGFFTELLTHAEAQIHASAQAYETMLGAQLETLIESNRRPFDEHPGFAEAIRSQIAQQNFLVAEDWMHRIRLGDFSLELQKPEALKYLDQFWGEYGETFRRVSDTSRPLSALISRKGIRNKDTKGAQQLIDAWLSNGRPSTPERIGQLLKLLGWQNLRVEASPAVSRTELYRVTRERSDVLTAPLHPIAAFGSTLDRKAMYAACLYGSYDCDRLYEKIRTLDGIDGNKVILLDYALGCADRRHLARKLKSRQSGLRNTYLVIDRVLLCHLADHYNENLINRMLMATAMPFSFYQPYVVESILTMPPEIFIGRKDELQKIEAPDGVNLIYGGRQLGKSALFKKALHDIDGRNDQRALLVDIKELGCADAAKKLCARLMDLDIIPEGELTSDWDDLCRRIERRLRKTDRPIGYLLLMMDEADAFISDCAALGYRPLAALKDLQQSLPGQFKFVLAGLHNIVRFNRQVALGRNSVITHLPSLKITPFRSAEAQELLTEPLSYLGFSLPSKVTVSQILATVNYFPGLIQLYCKKLIESIRSADYAGYDLKNTPPYIITDEHLRRVLADREFVEQIWEKLEITLTLGQEEGFCYYPLALVIAWMYDAEPSKTGYSARDVLRCAKDLNVTALTALDAEQIDAMMQELQDLNVLRPVSEGRYLLSSKNFRDMLGTGPMILEKLIQIGGEAA